MSFAARDPDPIDDDTSAEPLLANRIDKDRSTRAVPKSDVDLSDGDQHAIEISDQVDAGQACLVQIYPADFVGGMMLIESDELVIGRDSGADLVLSDISVSRRHAAIRRIDEEFEIEDLGSTNGTYVGGESARKVMLRSGDTIRVGTYLFKFLSAGSVESQYHETIYSALTRDALTGTMNQRYLLETLNRSIATANRQNTPVSVAMVDIDHFKSVNDANGHLVGDEVLREFARRISESCRADDLLARYGGEEFCILLTATELEEAVTVCDHCRQSISQTPFKTAIGPLSITASFGIACRSPGQNETAKELIQRADAKLYQAKRAGRNQVVW